MARALSLVFLLGCFPAGYWEAPPAGADIEVEHVNHRRGRTLYRPAGKGILIQTELCDGEGIATYTGETLRFVDGTECRVTQVAPRLHQDYASLEEEW